MAKPKTPPLVLASQSGARKAMLKNAGLSFKAVPADLNEKKIIAGMLAQKKLPQKIAAELAKQKAIAVSVKHPAALVIGADQILECEGILHSKAKNKSEAMEKLRALRGKSHRLVSAVSVVRGGKELWGFTDKVSLSMHNFDDTFLKTYAAKAGPALTRAVGAYELESHGAWLFERVEGDYFTVLGLPLLPLLSYLRREHGVKP